MRSKIIALGIVLVLLASGMLAGMLATGVQALSSDEGLVAEWHFDEGYGSVVKDTSGKGNDGTIYGATWVDGKYGKALSFDGVDDYVEVPDDRSLDLDDDFTIMAWTKLDKESLGKTLCRGSYCYPSSPTIINKEIYTGYASQDVNYQTNYYMMIDSNGTFRGGFEDNNVRTSDGNIQEEMWYFYALVLDETTGKLRLYINGKLKAESNYVEGDPRLNDVSVVIGRYGIKYDFQWHWFNGIIDEVRIYNRALTTNEIKTQYLALSSPTPTSTPTPTPPSGKIKAIWLYNPDKYDTSTLMPGLKLAGINTIFLSTDVNNIWKYERFVKSTHENEIKVHAMILEDPRCALKENHASAIKAVETVLDYNDKSLAKFDGINIDTEPYVDLDLEQVWQDYITLLEALHEKTAGKTVLSADIPRWYDGAKIKDLAPNVDFFVIMAYDSGGAGWNTASEIEDAVASEMGAIRGEDSKAVIGIGVHKGFRDKDAVEKCIEDLYTYYSDDPAFLGVSIFKYETYSECGFKHITIGELVEKLKKDPESVVGKKFATKGLVLVSTHEGYKGISTLWKILRITSLIGSAGIADIGEIPPEWLAADFMAIISNSAQDQDFCDMHKAFPYIEAYATNEELWAKSGSVINMEGEIEEKKILWHTFYVFKIENIEINSGYNNLRGLLKSNEKDKVKIMCVVDKNLNGMGLYDFIHIQTQQSVNVPYQALVEIEGVIKDIKTVEENGKEQYEYYIKANKVETILTVKEPPTRTAQTQTIAIQCPVNATITDQYNRIISDDGTNEIPNARMIITSKIKIFYLPADLRYSTEIEAYDTGTFNFTRVSPVEDDISITKFENVSVTENTKALVEIEPNVPDYTMSIDYDGDETIDEEKEPVKEIIEVAPEIPTPTPEPPGFEAVFAIVGLLVVAYVWGRRKK